MRPKPGRRFAAGFALSVILTGAVIAPAGAQNWLDESAGGSTEIQIETLRFGIQAAEGATRVLEDWAPTIAYLNSQAQASSLPYRFAYAPHTRDSMLDSIRAGDVDLVVSDPALYVAAEVNNGARALLSVAHFLDGNGYDRTGALVFARSDSGIRTLSDLEGRSVMAVAPGDFSGWWLAEQEFRRYRLEPEELLDKLVFSGGNQREVIYAVQQGLVDAGVVRSGLIEALAAEGVIDPGDFSPLSLRVHDEYPFWSSTELYPDWLVSALPSVPEPVLALVINALLDVSPDSPESRQLGGLVWQAPKNYQPVHNLLISLRAHPYENYLLQAARRIMRTYRLPIVGVLALTLFSLGFLAFQLRRNIKLAEAQRDVLKSEVRSRMFYRSAVEEHTVFCMMALDGRISHVNDSFCATTGRERASLVDTALSEILPENERDVLQGEIMTSMEVGVSWDGPLKLLKNDGSAAWVQCTVIPVSGAEESLSEIAIVATDMTATRKGIAEARFNDTLELMEDQVFVLRPETYDILYANRAAEEKLVREKLEDGWHGHQIRELLDKKEIGSLELRCQALVDGGKRRITWETTDEGGTPYEISLEYVEPENDEPRFIMIYRDISQRKAAEKAKKEFVATVSHELRTPLTSMKGALGLALSGAMGEMPDKMNKMLGMASTNCDRLITLINDILDLEKIEAGKMEYSMDQVDVAELVEQSAEQNKFFADKFGVTIEVEIQQAEGGLFARADKNRLTQVLDNLLSNAAKFSDKGEKIILSLGVHDGHLRLSVLDNGCGIPKSAHSTIFDKFTQADSSDTRSKGGTGLGLSIVRSIVNAHDGHIHFISAPKKGSEFFVDLPRLVDGKEIGLPVKYEGQISTIARNDAETEEHTEDSPARDGTLGQLLNVFRQAGVSVEIEESQITAAQLVSGRGVVGQSSVLNWLSDEGRSMIAGFYNGDMLDNCPVAVMEVGLEQDASGSSANLLDSKSELVGNWLNQLSKRLLPEGAPKLEVIGLGGRGVEDHADQVNYHPVSDIEGAIEDANQSGRDLVVRFERVANMVNMVALPLANGRLAGRQPIICTVARTENADVERGKVSKFARPSAARRRAGR